MSLSDAADAWADPWAFDPALRPSGLPRKRRVHTGKGRRSFLLIDINADAFSLDDLDHTDASGDDRSEFNLGAGGRWVPAAPTDE